MRGEAKEMVSLMLMPYRTNHSEVFFIERSYKMEATSFIDSLSSRGLWELLPDHRPLKV
jgi:hypothetical protein